MNEFSMKRKCSMQVTCVEHLDKGKRKVYLDTGESFILYRNEMHILGIHEDDTLTEEVYQYMIRDIIGKRAKKRALYLLEKMDRTESQLREKLAASEYPKQCIDAAITYMYQFHYLDDLRYARNFIRYSQEKLSRQQLKQKLIAKGVRREDIEIAFEEEYSSDERLKIQKFLQKKHYIPQGKDTAEFRKMYQYLLRRGFSSSDVLREMDKLDSFD